MWEKAGLYIQEVGHVTRLKWAMRTDARRRLLWLPAEIKKIPGWTQALTLVWGVIWTILLRSYSFNRLMSQVHRAAFAKQLTAQREMVQITRHTLVKSLSGFTEEPEFTEEERTRIEVAKNQVVWKGKAYNKNIPRTLFIEKRNLSTLLFLQYIPKIHQIYERRAAAIS